MDMSTKFLPILFYAQDKDWTADKDVDGRATAMASEAMRGAGGRNMHCQRVKAKN